MKVAIATAVKIYDFIEAHKDDNLSVKLAFKFAKIANALTADVTFFRQKYVEIIRTYAVINEDGSYKVEPENEPEYLAKMEELMELDVDVPDVNLTIDDFGDLTTSISEFSCMTYLIHE
jgi:hypothetical protein